MELFDSHAHLESSRFDADRAEVIARARGDGVTRILTCGSDLETSAQNVALAQQHPGLYAAVGIHGHRANTFSDCGAPGFHPAPPARSAPGAPVAKPAPSTPAPPGAPCWIPAFAGMTSSPSGAPVAKPALSRLADLAAQPGVVAIGEIGLDYHYTFSPADVQRAVLAQQLRLAHDLDLPVILHNRESDADLRALLDEAPPVRGVLHCFMADAAMARWALAKGLYLGVAGPITFPKVQHLAPILRDAPVERLLIETDCPYLAPQAVRGQRNEPAYVLQVAERLAEVLGLSLDELARRTTETACRLLGVTW